MLYFGETRVALLDVPHQSGCEETCTALCFTALPFASLRMQIFFLLMTHVTTPPSGLVIYIFFLLMTRLLILSLGSQKDLEFLFF